MLYITAMLCNLTQPLNHYISDSTKNECKTFCSIYTFNFNLNLVHVWWLFCMYVSFIKNWYNANIYSWLTWTHYSHISRMGAGVSSERKRFAALNQVHLCSCTPHISVPGWTTASSKGCRCVCSQVSQLTAHNCSISKIPFIVAHSAPLAKDEYLNTSISWISPSCQSDTAFFYRVIYCHICKGDLHEVCINNECAVGGLKPRLKIEEKGNGCHGLNFRAVHETSVTSYKQHCSDFVCACVCVCVRACLCTCSLGGWISKVSHLGTRPEIVVSSWVPKVCRMRSCSLYDLGQFVRSFPVLILINRDHLQGTNE